MLLEITCWLTLGIKGMKPNQWNTTVTQYEYKVQYPYCQSLLFRNFLLCINLHSSPPLPHPSLHISQFQNRLRQGSNFKHICYISANFNYKEENLLPPFSFIEKVISAVEAWSIFIVSVVSCFGRWPSLWYSVKLVCLLSQLVIKNSPNCSLTTQL